MSCGADTTANTLLTSLLQGKTFPLPDVDLSDPSYVKPDGSGELYTLPVRINNEDLTTKVVDGSGVFDALMGGIAAHLRREFEQNRITGQQYTEAFVGAAGGAMQSAVSFLLGRDQAYWQAINAELQARALEIGVITARVQLETAKAQLATARTQALTAEAEYGLTKIKISTEDQQYCLLKAQTDGVELDNDSKTYTNANILPTQKALLLEQIEVQRAQTLDTRTNGAVIKGSVGKQKDLYTQQIISYQRDAEVKAVKIFTDAWITTKTIDEGVDPPGAFANPSLNIMLKNIKQLNNLEGVPPDQYGTWNEDKENQAGYAKPPDVETP